jgi:hypothetical protein
MQLGLGGESDQFFEVAWPFRERLGKKEFLRSGDPDRSTQNFESAAAVEKLFATRSGVCRGTTGAHPSDVIGLPPSWRWDRVLRLASLPTQAAPSFGETNGCNLIPSGLRRPKSDSSG